MRAQGVPLRKATDRLTPDTVKRRTDTTARTVFAEAALTHDKTIINTDNTGYRRNSACAAIAYLPRYLPSDLPQNSTIGRKA